MAVCPFLLSSLISFACVELLVIFFLSLSPFLTLYVLKLSFSPSNALGLMASLCIKNGNWYYCFHLWLTCLQLPNENRLDQCANEATVSPTKWEWVSSNPPSQESSQVNRGSPDLRVSPYFPPTQKIQTNFIVKDYWRKYSSTFLSRLYGKWLWSGFMWENILICKNVAFYPGI